MRIRFWIPGLLALSGLAALVAVQQRIDRQHVSFEKQESLLYLSSGKYVKRLTFGYDGLLAGLYWTRAVQHYGSERQGLKRYNLLGNLLDITTTLDPDLLLAYRYGAVFLAAKYPDGPDRPDLAIQLLQKGIQAHPGYWAFWFDLGFVYYRNLKDYQKASEAFSQGQRVPGAPSWLQVLATRIGLEGGDRKTALFLWQQLYESTDDPSIRATAVHYLQGLRVDDEVEVLEMLVNKFQETAGRAPLGWQDLIQAGLLRGIPPDPAGHPYVLEGGRVLLNHDSSIRTSEKARAE